MTLRPGAIGDLARQTSTKVNTIRYYEDIGLMPVAGRTAGGRRTYGDDDIRRLTFIRQSRGLGFSLGAIRGLLKLADDQTQPCEAVDGIARTHLTEIKRKIAHLSALRGELERLIGSCQDGTVAQCKIIESLAFKGGLELTYDNSPLG